MEVTMTMPNGVTRLSNRHSSFGESDDWIWCSKKKRQDRGWYPNDIGRRLRDNKIEVVICINRGEQQGKDWACSATAAQDLLLAKREGRIAQAYVALKNPDGSIVAYDTLQNVWSNVKGTDPIDGKFGPYWWINVHFEISESGNPTDALFDF
jgi:hypothetical protein